MASRLPLILSCAPLPLSLLLALAASAGAAELGELRVGSYIGQPLAADIELVLLEAPATPVQARLAHPEVYRGANIGMPAVLSTLSLRVTQRDGKQFLHLASTAPVDASRLHVYLELHDGRQHDVRLATLSLAPNPNPPPPPAPPPAPPPVRAPVVAEVPAPVPVTTPSAPKPPAAARPERKPEPDIKPAPRPLPKKKAEDTPKPKPEPAPTPAPEPVPTSAPKPVLEPVLEPKPTPEPKPEPKPALPGAPVPLPPALSNAALDYKSAQLREQISVLEDKVRVLQVAMGANPADVSRDRPADAARPHPPRKRPSEKVEAEHAPAHTPWGWIGGAVAAVLALSAGVFVVWQRRKAGGRIQPIPKAPLMARLRARLARFKLRKKAGQAEQPRSNPPTPEAVQEVETQH